MTRKNSHQSVARTYSPELRLFSLTLQYYSPRTYCYVREKFGLCLPHPKTLYKWYRSVDGELGFNDEAIRYVKAYSDSLKERLFVTLIIDEVVIRQHLNLMGKSLLASLTRVELLLAMKNMISFVRLRFDASRIFKSESSLNYTISNFHCFSLTQSSLRTRNDEQPSRSTVPWKRESINVR